MAFAVQTDIALPALIRFGTPELKKDYLDTNIGDSLDLVPIAAVYGKG